MYIFPVNYKPAESVGLAISNLSYLTKRISTFVQKNKLLTMSLVVLGTAVTTTSATLCIDARSKNTDMSSPWRHFLGLFPYMQSVGDKAKPAFLTSLRVIADQAGVEIKDEQVATAMRLFIEALYNASATSFAAAFPGKPLL